MNPDAELIIDWNHLYTVKKIDIPLLLSAQVVHGFKRGSKELGIPTANLNMDELGDKGKDLDTGIYYGWGYLDGKIYEAVISVGYNPVFKNETKTIEAHLLQNDLDDFYGKRLDILFCGYLRQECSFTSLANLISAIHYDIDMSKKFLSEQPAIEYSMSVENWKK